MYSQKRHAFTLIELLVVISIIALLIGILLPALGAARNTARISQSASNQRQIGIAMATYQADNDERFPGWQIPANGLDPTAANEGWYWTTKLAVDNYIPGLDIYADPTFDADRSFLEEVSVGRGGSSSGVTKANQWARVFNWIHYGYNYVWVGSNLSASSTTRANAADRPSLSPYTPARVVDMEDATSVIVTSGVKDFHPENKHTDSSTSAYPIDPEGEYGAHVFFDYPNTSIGNAGVLHARYNGSVQNSWGDGHVSSLKMPFTQEEQDANPDGFTPQNGGKVPLYGPDALGDPRNWGAAAGRSGNSDPGNFFDLRGDNPTIE